MIIEERNLAVLRVCYLPVFRIRFFSFLQPRVVSAYFYSLTPFRLEVLFAHVGLSTLPRLVDFHRKICLLPMRKIALFHDGIRTALHGCT